MGHGDHWQAVEQEIDTYLDHIIPVVCKEGKIVGQAIRSYVLEEKETREAEVFGLQYPGPDSPVSLLAVIAPHYSEGTGDFLTAYPFCTEGITTSMTVYEVYPRPNGIEGTVETYLESTDTNNITFFDPLFFLNKDRYVEWGTVNVSLSALAYVMVKFEDDELAEARFSGAEEGEAAASPAPGVVADAEAGAEADAGVTAAETVSDDGYYYPVENVADSANLELRVEQAVPLACLGRIFWRLTGVIMRGEGKVELRINVYASEQVLKGYVPQVGDYIGAVAWMQGWIADPA